MARPKKLTSLDTLLSGAADQAVKQVAKKFAAIQSGSASGTVLVNAVIADISGRTVTLNKGSSDGLEVGTTLSVERVVKVIKDPNTGTVLRKVTESVGQIKLTEVDSDFAIGTITSGSEFNGTDLRMKKRV